MAGDVLWTRLKSLWRDSSAEQRKRALGLCFVFVVALIWVMSRIDHHVLCCINILVVNLGLTFGDPGVGLLPGARLGV